VFVDDDNIIKIHVHTNDPGFVLTKAVTYGNLVTVKIENMKNQHTSLSRDSVKADINVESEPQPLKKYGFVAVANGEGIADTFRDLGADELVYGGQTMNPSLESILRTINYTPAKTVFVLPNNSNIYLTAVQAAKGVKDKKVHVLPTKTIPQGVSAMLAFDSTVGAKRNLEAMQAAIDCITSDEECGTTCYQYNAWFSVSNIIEILRNIGTPEANAEAEKALKVLYKGAPEAIRATTEKVRKFAKPDGAFSYLQKTSTGFSQKAPVSIHMTVESDVNASVIATTGTTRNMYIALELMDYFVPFYDEEDREKFLNAIDY
jgi:hypothetical protein